MFLPGCMMHCKKKKEKKRLLQFPDFEWLYLFQGGEVVSHRFLNKVFLCCTEFLSWVNQFLYQTNFCVDSNWGILCKLSLCLSGKFWSGKTDAHINCNSYCSLHSQFSAKDWNVLLGFFSLFSMCHRAPVALLLSVVAFHCQDRRMGRLEFTRRVLRLFYFGQQDTVPGNLQYVTQSPLRNTRSVIYSAMNTQVPYS